MKIALVGKGGSGKSSVSWLVIKTLENMGSSVLAIDADHNMDLTSNLGLDPEKTPLMHRTDKEFMEAVGLSDRSSVGSITTDYEGSLPKFSIFPDDPYTESITTKINKSLSLINVGLGSPGVLFSNKCAHGLSGPLKYYLGLLEEKDSFVVIDSVAGADMLNYGLYAGIDAVIGVVEPHRNSIKVYEQILTLCKKSFLPCYLIINKPSDNEYYTYITNTYKDRTLGEVAFDEAIMNYDYSKMKESTKAAVLSIIRKCKTFQDRGNLNTVRNFQEMKSGTDFI